MTDMYMENNNGSKKKYLVPLVVLLLCAVSLTGAGYAYSSTVSNIGDADQYDFVIEIDDTDGAYYSIKDKLDIKYNNEITYAKPNADKSTTGSIVWSLDGTQTFTFVVKFASTDNNNTSKFALAAADVDVTFTEGSGLSIDKTKTTVVATEGATAGTSYTVTCTLAYEGATGTISVSSEGVADYTNAKEPESTVEVTIKVKATDA